MDIHKETANNPHSVVYWIIFEVQERSPDGRLKGSPKKRKTYQGVLHKENMVEAETSLELLANKIKEEVEHECK